MKYSSRAVLVIAALAAPNFLLAMVSFLDAKIVIAWVFLAFAVLGIVADVYVVGEFNRKVGSIRQNVVEIRRFSFDTFSHIIAYVPSLLAFAIDSDQIGYALIAFYVFYILIVAFSDVVILNPLFRLLGYQFLVGKLEFSGGTEEVLVVVPPNLQLTLGEADLMKLADFGVYLLDE